MIAEPRSLGAIPAGARDALKVEVAASDKRDQPRFCEHASVPLACALSPVSGFRGIESGQPIHRPTRLDRIAVQHGSREGFS
jgi:hypothetical protein